jgi:hypothetical protein
VIATHPLSCHRLRETRLREDLLTKRVLQRQYQKEEPEWTCQTKLRPTRKGAELQRRGTRSNRSLNHSISIVEDQNSAAHTKLSNLKPTRQGLLLSCGQSIRKGLLDESTTGPVGDMQQKKPKPRRGLIRFDSSDSLISFDGNQLLRPSAVVRKQKKKTQRAQSGLVTNEQKPESAIAMSPEIQAESPTTATVDSIVDAPKSTPDQETQPTVRGIRLKKQRGSASRRNLLRASSSSSGSGNGILAKMRKENKKMQREDGDDVVVTMKRQGSVRLGLGDDSVMLNVVKVQMSQPPNRGTLRTTSKGARLLRGESIRMNKSRSGSIGDNTVRHAQ